jgi:DNA-binding transcriptional ArsR family regulator
MENKTRAETKANIMDFLEKLEDSISISEIKRQMGSYSYPTILKWVTVLESEKKVSIVDYGNIKLVKLIR